MLNILSAFGIFLKFYSEIRIDGFFSSQKAYEANLLNAGNKIRETL